MIQRFENPIFKSSFLLLLFIPLQLVSFELTFAILFILTILLLNRGSQKISGDFITVILFLLILFLIGISTPFFYNYQLWDIAKDVSYFLKPILLLFLGYAFIHNIKDKLFLFKAFVSMAIVFAIFHLYKMLTYPDLFSTSINTIRTDTGLSNHVELVGLVFLILSFKFTDIQLFKSKKTRYAVLVLLFISFFLYFSRTMWVGILLLLVTSFGYAKISGKALKYVGIGLLFIAGFYIYLFSVEIPRDKPGISAFLYKMKIAPEEIFSPKVDLNNHEALWDHWRAYEAKMAFDQTHGFQHGIGRGFGSLVDLHFVAPLNDEGMRYISHLHNGYAMLYYKTGIVGLLFYILFLLNLYLFTFYKKHGNQNIPIENLIASMGIYLLFSTLIITGAYNLSDIYLLLLGGLLALYDKNKRPVENELNNEI